jgi:hypothetical protein
LEIKSGRRSADEIADYVFSGNYASLDKTRMVRRNISNFSLVNGIDYCESASRGLLQPVRLFSSSDFRVAHHGGAEGAESEN